MATEYTDEELMNYLKQLPEFGNLPLPESWYKKFDIPLLRPDNFKESVESNYCIKSSLNSTGFIKAPTPKDYVFPEVKADNVPLEVASKVIENEKPQETITLEC